MPLPALYFWFHPLTEDLRVLHFFLHALCLVSLLTFRVKFLFLFSSSLFPYQVSWFPFSENKTICSPDKYLVAHAVSTSFRFHYLLSPSLYPSPCSSHTPPPGSVVEAFIKEMSQSRGPSHWPLFLPAALLRERKTTAVMRRSRRRRKAAAAPAQ